jgi:hypothetical protein
MAKNKFAMSGAGHESMPTDSTGPVPARHVTWH